MEEGWKAMKLTQRLFDDIRIMQPEAWLDWQYMEEWGDQWCLINGSFQRQFYRKVKNYFVRQQCSRFIKRGYAILDVDCPQTLAAINPSRDTLTLVLLNEGEETIHEIALDNFTISQPNSIKIFRTSQDENLAEIKDAVMLKDNLLRVTLPKQSITTLVIK